MNKHLFATAALALVLLVSCSKERSIDSTDPDAPSPGGGGSGGGGNTSRGLLVKTVTRLGADSTVNDITYDAQGRFLRQRVTGDINLLEEFADLRVVRNAQGIIQQIITREEPGASDSTLYQVHYDATSKRYISKVYTEEFQGETYRDSTAYTYNAAGKISREIYYVTVSTFPYAEATKVEYTYNAAGNLVSATYYSMDPDTQAYEEVSQIVLEYDNKINPLNLGAEAIVLDKIEYSSGNNVNLFTYFDRQDPANNETISFAYIYGTDNKPLTVNITIESLGIPLPMTFRYN